MKEKVNIYVHILIQNSTATCDVSEHSNTFVVKNISFFFGEENLDIPDASSSTLLSNSEQNSRNSF